MNDFVQSNLTELCSFRIPTDIQRVVGKLGTISFVVVELLEEFSARIRVGVKLKNVNNESLIARCIQLDAGESPEVVHQAGNASGADMLGLICQAEITIGPLADAKSAINTDTNGYYPSR